MDYDPPHPGQHPVGANLPAALAIAESERLPGWRLIEAFVIGVELQIRTSLAQSSAPKSSSKGGTYFGRGVRGTLSAAMAAGKLLGLDLQRTRMALGIAAAKCGGIDSAGTMCNPGDSGNAASAGVQAALLARRGFTGRANAIELGYGFSQYLGEGADLELLVRDFPETLYLEKEPISIKKYPCQFPTHRHIDAILSLYRERPWRPKDIDVIEIELTLAPGNPAFNYHSVPNTKPADGMSGKFSVAYTAAVAAVDGSVGFGSFTDEKRFSPDVEDMLARVTVKTADERPATKKAMWSEARIRFKSGEQRSCRINLPRGFSGGDPLTREERVAKFTDCALRVVSKKKAQRIAALVNEVDTLDSLDELCTLLRG
jgi:2-methylcitrate dehydratase PrpD